MLNLYRDVDGLLFLSKAESYGFPLVEAMWIGLPIICPDLPYARTLCGNEAIYFDPKDVESLQRSVLDLRSRLTNGWWPDWSEQLRSIPKNWEEVAIKMARITTQ
jgi:glycosyltransferase involved in cell wall biosynthesis